MQPVAGSGVTGNLKRRRVQCHTELRRYENDTASGKGAEDYGCNRAHPYIALGLPAPPVNPEIAAKDRTAVLEASGAKPTDDMMWDFLGRPYSFKAYEEWLDGN